jgi:hypothetical protein
VAKVPRANLFWPEEHPGVPKVLLKEFRATQ